MMLLLAKQQSRILRVWCFARAAVRLKFFIVTEAETDRTTYRKMSVVRFRNLHISQGLPGLANASGSHCN